MAVHYGIVSGYGAFPVLFDPGNDLPARIWWVIREGGRLLLSFNDALLTEKRLDIGAHALGLSPSQFRVVVAIAEGLPLPEIARREGVRLTTVRTQLQRIFDKVGVRSQPALMRALLSAAEPEWAA